ncbi:MAG: DUF4097 domain-containing protein, partial [Terriglobia bacterium]
MKKLYPLSFLAGLALTALPLAALAQQAQVQESEIRREGRVWVKRIDCGAPLRTGGRLSVRADIGSVVVRAGREGRIECQVRLRVYTREEEMARTVLGYYRVQVRPRGGNVEVRGNWQDGSQSPAARGEREKRQRRSRWVRSPSVVDVLYEIRTPLQVNVDLETRGGDLIVEQLEGDVRAVTAGGGIVIGDTSGTVTAATAGGDIKLGDVGRKAEARTAGGSIRVGDVQGDAELETSGGEIVVGQVQGSLRAETAGGDIRCKGAGADIHAQTAGGRIHIGSSGGRVQAQTAGGSIRLGHARGPIRVETAGGSIDLQLVHGSVQAITNRGAIRAQIAATAENFGASMLETASGDIVVYLPPDLPLTIEAVIEQAAGHH